jgi:hypothetical protein
MEKIDLVRLSSALSLAAGRLLEKFPELNGVGLSDLQEAARTAGLPEINHPHCGVALAIHSYAVEIMGRRQGKFPSPVLVRKQQRIFAIAYDQVAQVA